MRVCVSLEERFVRTADGRVWSRYTSPYSFWSRYLDVFDEVRIIARVADATTEPDDTWKRADGEAVRFHGLPSYIGPLQYGLHFFSVAASMRKSISDTDAVIMRVPSLVAVRLERQLSPSRPFGLEVVGNVHEAFAAGSIEHPLRPFLQWYFTKQMKRQCGKAYAAAYVTQASIQRHFPPHKNAFSTTYSSVELDENDFVTNPRSFAAPPRPVRIITVGTLEVLYKGFDTLIDAASACIKAGLQLQVVIVGDGRCRPELERRAELCGIKEQIEFRGQLPTGEAVKKEFDQADLFVLASKSEGLPRAMIEAMARALPCIGSDVGGIPELLPREDLVPRGDAAALASKISEIVNDLPRMARMSAANLARAREYNRSLLTIRRRQFFSYVREATQDWVQRQTKLPVGAKRIENAKAFRGERSQAKFQRRHDRRV
jgi:glycosyltransferase involved in cell wall biosynthesis